MESNSNSVFSEDIINELLYRPTQDEIKFADGLYDKDGHDPERANKFLDEILLLKETDETINPEDIRAIKMKYLIIDNPEIQILAKIIPFEKRQEKKIKKYNQSKTKSAPPKIRKDGARNRLLSSQLFKKR